MRIWGTKLGEKGLCWGDFGFCGVIGEGTDLRAAGPGYGAVCHYFFKLSRLSSDDWICINRP